MLTFEEVFTFDNLLASAEECCNGVRWKASTQNFEAKMLMWVSNLHRQLMSGKYRSRGFNRFTICERGKVRHIQSVHISERCVQKCLVRYCLRPLVIPKLISDTYATLPGKGTEAALSRLREHLRWYYARHGRDGCILTMDYHDYFASIPHDRLMAMYSRLDMDERLLELAGYFVGCFDGDFGLGLGSEISQISAVFYTNPIDHLAKDRLGIHCYGRYMDDSYLIADRAACEAALDAITAMSTDMGLQLNTKATRITPLTQGFRYLKKRIMLTETGRIVMRLQRDNIRRERQRVMKNELMVAAGEMPRESADQSWQSWCSYASRYDARNTLATMNQHRLEAISSLPSEPLK